MRQEILLTVLESQDRDPAALRGLAMASRALHADAVPFLTRPVERRIAEVDSPERAEQARQDIAALHPSLRAGPVSDLVSRWPALPGAAQVAAAPVMLASLDTVMASTARRPGWHQDDPFSMAAIALRRLGRVQAVALGFNGILQRIDQLPLQSNRSWPAWHEDRLCQAIPKLPTRERRQAFDRMLQTFETRFKPEGSERSSFLPALILTVPSLRSAEQVGAIDRLFQNLREVGNHDTTRTVLSVLRLDRLKAGRRPTFDQMIDLARALPKNQRAPLLFPHDSRAETWVDAFEGADRDHARAQVNALNELHRQPG